MESESIKSQIIEELKEINQIVNGITFGIKELNEMVGVGGPLEVNLRSNAETLTSLNYVSGNNTVVPQNQSNTNFNAQESNGNNMNQDQFQDDMDF